MRLADTGRTEEDDVLGALDEGQAGELVDLGARYAGGEAEVKAVDSRKSAKEASFAAALWAMPEYRLGIALNRNSWHNATMR